MLNSNSTRKKPNRPASPSKTIDKDLLKGMFTLKGDAVEKFYASTKTITAEQVAEIFKLKPEVEKDKVKIDAFTKAIPALADKDLELIKGLKKVTSLEGNLPFMIFLAFFSITDVLRRKDHGKARARKSSPSSAASSSASAGAFHTLPRTYTC